MFFLANICIIGLDFHRENNSMIYKLWHWLLHRGVDHFSRDILKVISFLVKAWTLEMDLGSGFYNYIARAIVSGPNFSFINLLDTSIVNY